MEDCHHLIKEMDQQNPAYSQVVGFNISTTSSHSVPPEEFPNRPQKEETRNYMGRCIGTTDHDPKNLHEGFDMSFSGIIAEPKDQRMFEPLWQCMKIFYIILYQIFYTILVVLAGPILVCGYSIIFSVASFSTIWCCTPLFKLVELVYMCLGRCWKLQIRILCDPVFESIGRVYSQINVKHNNILGAASEKGKVQVV